jgi:transposase, putative, N-terminal domain
VITLECLIEFETKEDINAILDLMRRFSSAMRYAYKRLLEGEKRKDLKKHLSKLFNINTRLKCGNSKTATQQTVNQQKEQVRRLPPGRHKSWQVLFTALAFCYLEKSYIDFSPLKRVIISKNWIAVANRLVPVLGAGTTSMPRFMTLPKYRLLGLEVSEMAEYKYPNSSCAEQYSFVQFG